MMKPNQIEILAVALSMAAAGSAMAATVYEVPAPNPGPGQFHSDNRQYGDEIILGGTDRIITGITLPYYSNFAATGGLTFALYDNTGAGGSPGALLYQSDPIDLLNGGGTISIAFPAVVANTIPDHLTYTVSIPGAVGNNNAGLIVPNLTPTVGTSFNDFWVNTGTSGNPIWQENVLVGGDLANFQISITAVPEPGPLALAGAGVAGWLVAVGYRRFQRR